MSTETLPAPLSKSARQAVAHFLEHTSLRKSKKRQGLIDTIATAQRPLTTAKRLLKEYGKPKPVSSITHTAWCIMFEHFVAKSGMPDPTVMPLMGKAARRASKGDLTEAQAKHYLKIAGKTWNGRCQDEIDESRDAARIRLNMDPYIKPPVKAAKPVAANMPAESVADAICYDPQTASTTDRRMYQKALAENEAGELTHFRAAQIARLIGVRKD